MKILFVSPVPTDPPNAGNRARVFHLVQALRDFGHSVTFAYIPYEPADLDAMRSRFGKHLYILRTNGPPAFHDTVAKLKRKLGRLLHLEASYRWGVDEWFDPGLTHQVTELNQRYNFDIAMIEYVFLSPLTAALRHSVRTIIDIHDLMGDRHKMLLAAGVEPNWFATTRQEEISALNRAHATIAIQEEEAAYLREHTSTEVFCVGPIGHYSREPLGDPANFRLLFVGSANPINMHALERFVASTLVGIRVRVPQVELAIAGRAGIRDSWPNGVVALGEVPSLEVAYAQAAVVVNPVTAGTGFNIKTIEALGYGKPLVTTQAGVRGLGAGFEQALHVADDEQSFVNSVVSLLRSKSERTALAQRAFTAAQTWRRRQLDNLRRALLIAPISGDSA